MTIESASGKAPGRRKSSSFKIPGMSQHAYIRYRKERGLTGDRACLRDRIDFGWVRLNEWNYIDPEQADAVWDLYKTGMRCPDSLHPKQTLEMSKQPTPYGKAQPQQSQQPFLDPIARRNLAEAKKKEYELAVLQAKLIPYDAVLDFLIKIVATTKEVYSQQTTKALMEWAAQNNLDTKQTQAASHRIIQGTFAQWSNVEYALREYLKTYFANLKSGSFKVFDEQNPYD